MEGAPITEKQKIDYAMLIILQSKPFKNDIKEWNKKPAADTKWTNFGTHFTKAYNNLIDTGNLVIKYSPSCNQANSAEAVLNAMRLAQKEHLLINKNDGNGKHIPPTMSTRGQILRTPLVKNANIVNISDDNILKKLKSPTAELAAMKGKVDNIQQNEVVMARKSTIILWVSRML